jgi:hypothetical protein
MILQINKQRFLFRNAIVDFETNLTKNQIQIDFKSSAHYPHRFIRNIVDKSPEVLKDFILADILILHVSMPLYEEKVYEEKDLVIFNPKLEHSISVTRISFTIGFDNIIVTDNWEATIRDLKIEKLLASESTLETPF